MTKKTTCMIPTYNESANIVTLLDQIMALNVPGHEIHALVVDDNSPDGTAKLVEDYSKKNPRVKIVVRKNQRGRGTAGLCGFKFAIEDGADYVIEMDADFSHDPKYIPDLIKAADSGADLVIGSRFVPGGADEDRGFKRRIFSKMAGFYVRTVLSMQVNDITAGYRLFRRDVLKSIDLDRVESVGPAIVPETLYKAHVRGAKVVEVPIIFIDRRAGSSKLNSKQLAEELYVVAKMRFLNLTGRL